MCVGDGNCNPTLVCMPTTLGDASAPRSSYTCQSVNGEPIRPSGLSGSSSVSTTVQVPTPGTTRKLPHRPTNHSHPISIGVKPHARKIIKPDGTIPLITGTASTPTPTPGTTRKLPVIPTTREWPTYAAQHGRGGQCHVDSDCTPPLRCDHYLFSAPRCQPQPVPERGIPSAPTAVGTPVNTPLPENTTATANAGSAATAARTATATTAATTTTHICEGVAEPAECPRLAGNCTDLQAVVPFTLDQDGSTLPLQTVADACPATCKTCTTSTKSTSTSTKTNKKQTASSPALPGPPSNTTASTQGPQNTNRSAASTMGVNVTILLSFLALTVVCVVVGVVGKRRLRHVAHPFSTSPYAFTDPGAHDTVPMLHGVLENASAGRSVYLNPSYHPSQHQHQHQQPSRQHQHHHYTADSDGNVPGAALADFCSHVLHGMDHNSAELAEAEFSAYPTAGAASLARNTIPDIPIFSSPRQRPRIVPTAQTADPLSARIHAPSSCKLEFADNVPYVDVHAHTVGAMHAHAQPLPHSTHSPMAFGDASYYPQPNTEATTYHPSTLPLDLSPHHAWPTCHQDGPLPQHGPTQGIAMVSLWHTACFVVCPPCMCTNVLFYTAESRHFQVYMYVLQYILHVQACAQGVHMRRAHTSCAGMCPGCAHATCPYCDAV